jgi:hypothetical protein
MPDAVAATWSDRDLGGLGPGLPLEFAAPWVPGGKLGVRGLAGIATASKRETNDEHQIVQLSIKYFEARLYPLE